MTSTLKDLSGLDLSIPTLTELMARDQHIYELCQAIRHRLRIVVDLRLAAKITQAEYFDAQQLSRIETAECSRLRSEILIEMTRRRQARQPQRHETRRDVANWTVRSRTDPAKPE